MSRMMSSLWEHEDRTEQIPAYPVTGEFQALLGPDDPFPVQHAARPRSIFVPVFWGVLCALVVFTLLMIASAFVFGAVLATLVAG